MDQKTQNLLAQAKDCFYSWRMAEAYNILRRFFDRLPFQPEREHAELVGIFSRILLELGKEYELKFYMGELERHYQKSHEPHIAYPLGVIYTHSPHRWEAAKKIFDEIVRNPSAKEWHAKAKMQLARYYQDKRDIASCRILINSIQTSDPELIPLVQIWDAVVLREEKQYDRAVAVLRNVIEVVDPNKNWYAHLSAQLVLAMVYINQKNAEKAAQVTASVRAMFEGRHFKTVEVQLAAMERLIEESLGLGTIVFKPGEDESLFVYGGRTLSLKPETPAEKLMVLLVKRRILDKANIVKSLYDRKYNGEQDDKLIYYHIHALRKRLKSIGLPANAIASEPNGYRLVPAVETSLT